MTVPIPSGVPLWSRRDAATLTTLLAVGGILVAASWFFAAGRADAGDQLVFVTPALLGAVVGMAAVVGWTVHARRTISAPRCLLLGTAPPGPADAATSLHLGAYSNCREFHRADCLLADGR